MNRYIRLCLLCTSTIFASVSHATNIDSLKSDEYMTLSDTNVTTPSKMSHSIKDSLAVVNIITKHPEGYQGGILH